MTIHTTNYTDALILPSPDTKAESAAAPPTGKGSVAELQYERLAGNEYAWTSDDLLFDIHCVRRQIAEADRTAEREAFFSKGQPCLRTSPLAKTYGWAFHFDSSGRVALVPMCTERLAELEADPAVEVTRAMRSKR